MTKINIMLFGDNFNIRKDDKMEEKKQCSSTDCSKSSCEGCENSTENLIEKLNQFSSIKNVIGVASGKGGVGKSLVTSSLAVELTRKGFKVGILDADITCPSIPKMFNIKERALANENGILPRESKLGIKIMSLNLLIDKEETPVVWRGPIIAGTVKQFWTDVLWGELDYLLIDLPPGTGDVPLTVFQSLPINGIVIVSTPQDLVSMIVKKAYNMAQMMNIPVIGFIENMSYVKCPDCNTRIDIFGESKLKDISLETGVDIIAQIPMEKDIIDYIQIGEFEKYESNYFEEALDIIIKFK